MFGIDGPEFVVILIVLIVVVGPKDLPKMLKALGKATARMRSTANEFRRQFDEAMHEAELDDLQKTISDVKDIDPRKKLTELFDPIRDVAKDVKASIDFTSTDDEEVKSSDPQNQSDAADGKDVEKEDVEKQTDGAKKDQAKGGEKSLPQVEQSSVRILDEAKFQSATAPKVTAAADLGQMPQQNEAKPQLEKTTPKSKKTAETKNRPASKSKQSATGKTTSGRTKTATARNASVRQKQKSVNVGVPKGEKTNIVRSSKK